VHVLGFYFYLAFRSEEQLKLNETRIAVKGPLGFEAVVDEPECSKAVMPKILKVNGAKLSQKIYQNMVISNNKVVLTTGLP
jgi:hypothetical protein